MLKFPKLINKSLVFSSTSSSQPPLPVPCTSFTRPGSRHFSLRQRREARAESAQSVPLKELRRSLLPKIKTLPLMDLLLQPAHKLKRDMTSNGFQSTTSTAPRRSVSRAGQRRRARVVLLPGQSKWGVKIWGDSRGGYDKSGLGSGIFGEGYGHEICSICGYGDT